MQPALAPFSGVRIHRLPQPSPATTLARSLLAQPLRPRYVRAATLLLDGRGHTGTFVRISHWPQGHAVTVSMAEALSRHENWSGTAQNKSRAYVHARTANIPPVSDGECDTTAPYALIHTRAAPECTAHLAMRIASWELIIYGAADSIPAIAAPLACSIDCRRGQSA